MLTYRVGLRVGGTLWSPLHALECYVADDADALAVLSSCLGIHGSDFCWQFDCVVGVFFFNGCVWVFWGVAFSGRVFVGCHMGIRFGPAIYVTIICFTLEGHLVVVLSIFMSCHVSFHIIRCMLVYFLLHFHTIAWWKFSWYLYVVLTMWCVLCE